MAIRIDVVPTIPDARGDLKLRAFRELLGSKIKHVVIVDSYIVDTDLSKAGLEKARRALSNSLVEKSVIGRFAPARFSYGIEVGYLPGVTDNVGQTAEETIQDATGHTFKDGEHVYSVQVIYLDGALTKDDAWRVAKTLFNPLIQSARIIEPSTLSGPVHVPKVALHGSSRVLTVDVDIDDDLLERLGKEGIQDENGVRRGPLALSLQYMKAIQAHFKKLKRNPTDVELEALAQTWSEHCKHTIFASPIDSLEKGIYKTYIKGATEKIRNKKGKRDFCLSVFKDNAGAIVFDDTYAITHKVETHNSPSALDPYGGVLTGIVGVNRDTLGFGLGAKPVANVYGFCLSDPLDSRRLFRNRDLSDEMLSAKRIMEGVIKGVNAGGNQSGIPTPHGFLLFDETYRGKPLVFAGTVGLIPRKHKGRVLTEKRARPGDYIVIVGGRTGLDGIHGATFSSEGLDSGSPATAVQIGDPITQKKMSDAIVKEARDMGLYNSITDNGAGGFSSSISEMAREAGGCKVSLEKAPLKYPGLEPWQIWISESQERMTLSVPKSKWSTFASLMKRRGVEATVVGEFTNSGKVEVLYGHEMVMSINLEFLHDGLPEKKLTTAKPKVKSLEPTIKIFKEYTGVLDSLLGRPNLTSHEFVPRQYDHEVQGGSVIKPIQGSGRIVGDASVFRPVLASRKAAVLTSALAPYMTHLDPYHMATTTVDMAVRQAVAAGASIEHLALLDNFCWASSNDPERLYELKEAARGAYDAAIAYGTPYISGKDSMFNDFKGYSENGEPLKISVLPTLLISALGVIEDAQNAISIDLKRVGDELYLIGRTNKELGGSEFYRMISEHGQSGAWGTRVPGVDFKEAVKSYTAFARANKAGLINSAISVGRGGLAVALARSSMAGSLGAIVDLSKIPGNANAPHEVLFSESNGRILFSANSGSGGALKKYFKGVPLTRVGVVASRSLLVTNGKKKLIRASVETLRKTHRKRFQSW